MSDDKTAIHPQDPQRVNVSNDYEVPYWTDLFGCTTEELQAAVRNVGINAVDVERELQQIRS